MFLRYLMVLNNEVRIYLRNLQQRIFNEICMVYLKRQAASALKVDHSVIIKGRIGNGVRRMAYQIRPRAVRMDSWTKDSPTLLLDENDLLSSQLREYTGEIIITCQHEKNILDLLQVINRNKVKVINLNKHKA